VIPWLLECFHRGKAPTYFPYFSFIRSQAAGSQEMTPIFRCGACRGLMTVGSDGTLYPCHRFVGMSHFALGNVTDGLNCERIRDFWRSYCAAIQNEHCSKCWALGICARPCPWSLAKFDGTFAWQRRAQHTCDYEFFTRAAWMLAHLQEHMPEWYRDMTAGCGARREQTTTISSAVQET